MLSRIPFFKVVAIVQVALLVRRHLKALSLTERRRMAELARRAHRLNADERRELRAAGAEARAGRVRRRGGESPVAGAAAEDAAARYRTRIDRELVAVALRPTLSL